MIVEIQRLENAKDLPLPSYGSTQAAGLDLHAANEEEIVLKKGDWVLVPTGYAIAIPVGYEAQIRSRSGLSFNNGVIVLNAPGTIDSDYRGEIKVVLANFGDEPFCITRGTRIAQMVITKHDTVRWCEVNALSDTDRGDGGFGSTGL